MATAEELAQNLRIDKHSLDDEVIQQPSLFYEVSEQYIRAAAERDQLKEELANVDAKLDAEVRSTLGDVKATEGKIKSRVQIDPKHAAAFDAWLVAKEQADRLGVLKDAFQQRSYMLRDLVALNTSNYFEETSVRSGVSHDRAVYSQQRARLTAARETKAK